MDVLKKGSKGPAVVTLKEFLKLIQKTYLKI